MYIDKFVAGILVTILSELLALVVMTFIKRTKKEKK